MRSFCHSYVQAILLIVACQAQGAESALRPVTEADSVLAVYTENWELGAKPETRLILAVWNDGYVVWSEDRLRGGAPYHTGRTDPKRLDSLLSGLEQKGLFADKSLADWQAGPDSEFTTILVRFKKKELAMKSWHELAESEAGVIAAAHGLTGLNGQRLFQVLKKQPPDYLVFRYIWSDIRARAAELVPSADKPTRGEVVKKHGVMSWRELPVPAERSK